MPKIIRLPLITRQHVRANPSTIFIFGDNLQERGLGGQAAAMRGEPNTVGIPTKHAPDNRPSSFFSDADFDRIKPFIDEAFDKIEQRLRERHDIVISENGIGTGHAQLATRAPKLYDYIVTRLRGLESLAKRLNKESLPISLQKLVEVKASR